MLLERLFSCNSGSITAAHVRDDSTAMICFVQKCNWLCFNAGCHVFTNRHAYVYNVRKLDFQANLCEDCKAISANLSAFDYDKKQHYCGDLVLGWVV